MSTSSGFLLTEGREGALWMVIRHQSEHISLFSGLSSIASAQAQHARRARRWGNDNRRNPGRVQ